MDLGLVLIAVGVVVGAGTLAVAASTRRTPLTRQRRTAALLLALAGAVVLVVGLLLG